MDTAGCSNQSTNSAASINSTNAVSAATLSSGNKMNTNILKLPSYVGLSCAVSGYTNYSPYCYSGGVSGFTSNAGNGINRGSPSCSRKYDVNDQKQANRHQNDSNRVQVSGEQIVSTIQVHQYHNQHHNDIKSVKNNQSNDVNATSSIGSTFSTLIRVNGCVHREDMKDNDRKSANFLLQAYHHSQSGTNTENEDSDKSLVQKRIESLYGPNAAEIWRDSRSRVKRSDRVDGTMLTGRSPSCPPLVSRSRDNKRSPAVFNHLDQDFLNQIDREPVSLKVNRDEKKMITKTVPPNCKPNSSAVQAKKKSTEDQDKRILINDPSASEPNLAEKKGSSYLKKLDSAVDKIRQRINVTETFMKDESHLMSDEVTGNLLSSIGKANLLIGQKLEQFRELCHKNMNEPSEGQFITKNEDLDGFWEMVSIQIDVVHKLFDDVLLMRRNNWTIQEPLKETLPKTARPPKKNVSSKVATCKLSTKNTARDELRKAKLKEAKLRQAQRVQDGSNEEIAIFVPSNGEQSERSDGS
ncbi:uncharacterized protein LOC141855225 [Brevipalpus obovatus]|uniref:uncharacterized protein LOC141855225 n=1 Tax=Brevipalpus obovatus TaxID=246614 RepID=UPI003D9F552F